MSRSFPRLYRFAVNAPTDQDTIVHLIARLEGQVKRVDGAIDLTKEERRQAASYLRLLASKGKDILRRKYPRRTHADDVALDYAATVRRLGGARAAGKRARGEVANAWKLSDATVKDYWSNYKTAANYQLAELLRDHVRKRGSTLGRDGIRRPINRTEREVLEAISFDLRDRRKM